jgi:chromosomal replication initiation ATPase DnaA
VTRQLPLDLGFTPSYSAADYLVSTSNAAAWGWIERWPDWLAPGLAICGPPGCGKTHLAHVWQSRSGAAMIDAGGFGGMDPLQALGDAAACIVDGTGGASLTAAEERALLHLYNVTAERGGQMLVCGRSPPTRWPIALPDLRSRLVALPFVAIEPPDDGLLEALLAKLFADRQLTVDRGTIIFIVARMERSFDAARRLVDVIDRAALAAGRRPGLGLVREIIERLEGGAS